MDLADYFAKRKGTGIFATADAAGKVNAAVFSRPHILPDKRIAFIMREKLTHHNLMSNPHAAFMFIEADSHWKGKRLYLTKTGEEKDSDLLRSLRRGHHNKEDVPRYLVFFRLDKVLPLIGAGENEEANPDIS